MEGDIDASLSEYPDDPTLRLTRGSNRFAKKLWADAMADLDVFIRVHAFDAGARRKHEVACLNLKRWDDAKKDLDELIANDAKDGQAFLDRGTIAVTRDHGADGIDDLGKAIDYLTATPRGKRPSSERSPTTRRATSRSRSTTPAST